MIIIPKLTLLRSEGSPRHAKVIKKFCLKVKIFLVLIYKIK
jgi:hypothetical protein